MAINRVIETTQSESRQWIAMQLSLARYGAGASETEQEQRLWECRQPRESVPSRRPGPTERLCGAKFPSYVPGGRLAHPGDTIPPILAVSQVMRCSGARLLRGIVAAYEIQIDLCRSISLHNIKSITWLIFARPWPESVRCFGCRSRRSTAVQQAVHVSFTTRQSRKRKISSWKAYARTCRRASWKLSMCHARRNFAKPGI